MKKKRPGEDRQLLNVDELLEADNDDDITEIRLELIDTFEDHPFKVLDDEMMEDLASSIRRNGILTPVLVRPKLNGRYEMISGHRRMRAAQIVELETIPAIIRDMDDIDAVIVMVDANLKRERLLPSEMAFAFRMRYEAVKRKSGVPGISGRVLNGRTAIVNDRGNVTGVFDAEIISYLIGNMPIFILNRVPYLYENGL